jgi:hypothetical protein
MFCLTLAFVSAMSGQQTPDWSDYESSSLQHAWSVATIVEGAAYTIEAGDVKFAVSATYTGERHEIANIRRELLRRWAKALRHPADSFEHEIHVRAGNDSYWLPLQDPLLQPFIQEAPAGTRVRLFIMYIGANAEDRLFVVNEFQVLTN